MREFRPGKPKISSSIRKVVHEPFPPDRVICKRESPLDWPPSLPQGMATQMFLISQRAGPTVSSSWESQWELRRVRIPSASPWAHLAQAAPVYIHFIARGRDVVFPENTAMQIGISVRPTPSAMVLPQ